MFQLTTLLFLNLQVSLYQKEVVPGPLIDFYPNFPLDHGQPVRFSLFGSTWISAIQVYNPGCKDVDSVTIRIFRRSKDDYEQVNENDDFTGKCNHSKVQFTNVGNFQHFVVLITQKGDSSRKILWKKWIKILTTPFPLKKITVKRPKGASGKNSAMYPLFKYSISKIVWQTKEMTAKTMPAITVIARTNTTENIIERVFTMRKLTNNIQEFDFNSFFLIDYLKFLEVGDIDQTITLYTQNMKKYRRTGSCFNVFKEASCKKFDNQLRGMIFVPVHSDGQKIALKLIYKKLPAENERKSFVVMDPSSDMIIPLNFNAESIKVYTEYQGLIVWYTQK